MASNVVPVTEAIPGEVPVGQLAAAAPLPKVLAARIASMSSPSTRRSPFHVARRRLKDVNSNTGRSLADAKIERAEPEVAAHFRDMGERSADFGRRDDRPCVLPPLSSTQIPEEADGTQ